MGVGGCLCICHLRSDTVGAVITEHCAIPPPGDSGGRTTSGGAGEGEHRRVSGWVSIQLEGNFTLDSNLACWKWKNNYNLKFHTNMLQTEFLWIYSYITTGNLGGFYTQFAKFVDSDWECTSYHTAISIHSTESVIFHILYWTKAFHMWCHCSRIPVLVRCSESSLHLVCHRLSTFRPYSSTEWTFHMWHYFHVDCLTSFHCESLLPSLSNSWQISIHWGMAYLLHCAQYCCLVVLRCHFLTATARRLDL